MATFNQDDIGNRLSTLSADGQVFFSFLCAERLVACCWAFSQKESYDISIYSEACETVFAFLSTGVAVDLQKQDELITRLEEAIPHSDDFGYPLAVQAQSGMLALLYCLKRWRNGASVDVGQASGSVVDALDNYEFFVHEILEGAAESPTEYPLLDRELQWQNETISLLSRETLSGSAALAVRVLNRSYIVPPAVVAETV